jgi:hypothetical protein
MKALIVLFRLKPGADRAAYENWARQTDLPVVRNLSSVRSFDLYRTLNLFGSGEPAPYEYVEVIRIADLDRFGSEVASATMQKVAGEFRGFADNPLFMLAELASEDA